MRENTGRTWAALRLSRWSALAALICLSTACGAGKLESSQAVSAMNVAVAEQLPPAEFGAALAAMETGGVKVVRSDAPWADIQPRPPAPGNPGWHWGQTDAWVTAFARHDLTWEPILDYAVGWAKVCPGICAPTSNTTYAAFAQAVAARYGLHGTFWAQHPEIPSHPVRIFEIWNEENVSTFHIPPERYASLYASAREAIRRVDPSASVIVGGLADDSGPFNIRQDYPSRYVRAMFASMPGLVGHVGAFGLHPYGSTAVDVEEWTVHFRQTLDALGERSAPILITEFGWPTGTPQGEGWRAQQMRLVGHALSRSDCGVRLLAPYDWINPGSEPPADFGLAQARAVGGGDQALRPAGIAWLQSLRGRRPELRLCAEAGA